MEGQDRIITSDTTSRTRSRIPGGADEYDFDEQSEAEILDQIDFTRIDDL